MVQTGLNPVVQGILAGLLLSLALSRLLRRFLYEIEPTDPVSFLLGTVALLSAGALAALVPAWRASRVDPSTVLRVE